MSDLEVLNWWIEYDRSGEPWQIEVRSDGQLYAVAFTRPITVEYRL